MIIGEISVSCLDTMGSDLTVVDAARVSFDKQSKLDEVGSVVEQDKKLIKYLAEHNHWTPFGHCFASFRIKAPIFVARQLVKHQVGLVWNEVSRRYVDSEPAFFFPRGWRAKADNVKQGSSNHYLDPHQDKGNLNTMAFFCAHGSLDIYEAMLASGVCPEQARMVLPLNTMTEWVWSGSLAAWARVVKLRTSPHTQAETREVAEKIDGYMATNFPVSWEALLGVNDEN